MDRGCDARRGWPRVIAFDNDGLVDHRASGMTMSIPVSISSHPTSISIHNARRAVRAWLLVLIVILVIAAGRSGWIIIVTPEYEEV